mmetsp:Transcript_4585/g.6861  ORF Transcript_4585/g.6861 Transcript_4585/m.6861 type:complete len:499 (+) Transcript_4585:127-1623(+)
MASDTSEKTKEIAVEADAIFNLPLSECYFVIDARSKKEFQKGHMVTARSLHISDDDKQKSKISGKLKYKKFLQEEMDDIPPDKFDIVIVYSDSQKENMKSLKHIVSAIHEVPNSSVVKHYSNFSEIWVLFEYSKFSNRYPFLVTSSLYTPHLSFYPNSIQGVPNLYIGSASSARNDRAIKDLNITHIVNATTREPNHFVDKCKYLRLAIEDTIVQDLSDCLSKSFAFISAALKENEILEKKNNILVHCHQGKSRSASVVIHYMILSSGLTYNESLKTLRTTRKIAKPNEGFEKQLRRLERIHKSRKNGGSLGKIEAKSFPKDSVATKRQKLALKKVLHLRKKMAEDPMTMIEKGLYIGNLTAASDLEKLKEAGITHILIVATGLKPRFPAKFIYKAIPVRDRSTDSEKLYKSLQTCYDFACKAKESKDGTLLVHCFKGASRSATVVASILMRRYGWGVEKTLGILKSKRPIVHVNEGFRKMLGRVENEMRRHQSSNEN